MVPGGCYGQGIVINSQHGPGLETNGGQGQDTASGSHIQNPGEQKIPQTRILGQRFHGLQAKPSADMTTRAASLARVPSQERFVRFGFISFPGGANDDLGAYPKGFKELLKAFLPIFFENESEIPGRG